MSNANANVTVTTENGPVPSTSKTAPPLVLPGYGQFQPREMTIASVHFLDLRKHFHHSRNFKFEIKAPKKGEVGYLTVYDSQQWIRDCQDPLEPLEKMMPAPVPVESIVKDCVDDWSDGGIGESAKLKFGVMAIKGSTCTPEEKSKLMKMQELKCQALVMEADRIEKGVIKGAITDLHRKALDWLDSERRPWYHPIEAGRTKKSVVSGNRIPAEAVVDPSGVDLIEYYIKYSLNPIDFEDHYIDKLFKSRPDIVTTTKKRLGLV